MKIDTLHSAYMDHDKHIAILRVACGWHGIDLAALDAVTTPIHADDVLRVLNRLKLLVTTPITPNTVSAVTRKAAKNSNLEGLIEMLKLLGAEFAT